MAFKNKDALARHGGASYQLRRVLRDGRYDHFVEVGCSRCPATVELHQGNNTDTTDPDLIRKRMTGKGWTFHPYKARAILCPKCQVTQKEEEMPSKPTLVVAEMAQTQAPMGPRTGLTSEERFKVRQLLDTHFDDKVGAYLNNYSDQKIGEDVNVPWKFVHDLREMAYGPIREDPKMVAFRNDLSKLERDLAELKVRFTTFSKGATK